METRGSLARNLSIDRRLPRTAREGMTEKRRVYFCLCSLSWDKSAAGGGCTYFCRVSVFECEVSSEPPAAPLVGGVSVSFRVILLHSAGWPCNRHAVYLSFLSYIRRPRVPSGSFCVQRAFFLRSILRPHRLSPEEIWA